MCQQNEGPREIDVKRKKCQETGMPRGRDANTKRFKRNKMKQMPKPKDAKSPNLRVNTGQRTQDGLYNGTPHCSIFCPRWPCFGVHASTASYQVLVKSTSNLELDHEENPSLVYPQVCATRPMNIFLVPQPLSAISIHFVWQTNVGKGHIAWLCQAELHMRSAFTYDGGPGPKTKTREESWRRSYFKVESTTTSSENMVWTCLNKRQHGEWQCIGISNKLRWINEQTWLLIHLKMHEKATGILLQSLQMSCGRAIFLQVSFAKFCQHLQKPSAKFGKTCLGRFGIGHLPWQNAPHWDRKTRGDFHWLSRSAKRTSEERPTCGRNHEEPSFSSWLNNTNTNTPTHPSSFCGLKDLAHFASTI